MRWFVMCVVALVSCRGAQAPEGEEPSPPQQTSTSTPDQSPHPMPPVEPSPEQPAGPLPAHDVTCQEPGLEAYRGIVERQGADFALRSGDRSIPLWEISQQEATAPRSPDFAAQVGQDIVVCGDFNGSALYRVRPAQQSSQP